MRKLTSLSFKFKGNRNYVQGPDMLNEKKNRVDFNEATQIALTIYEMLQTNADLHRLDGNESIPKEAVAVLRVKKGEKQETYVIVQNNNFISDRYPYDESIFGKICSMSDQTISLNEKAPYSFIETVVAMFKKLLQTIYPTLEGKWLFTHIELNSFKEVSEDLKITHTHNLGDKLMKANISHGQESLGHIQFVLRR